MADLGTAYISIVPSTKGMGSTIANDLSGAAEPASQSFGLSFISKLKGLIGTAALGKVVVDAFKEGAALEQSIGGIETLYGRAADTVRQYASTAWKDAGISANTYMEQATSYAASLMSSLGGDQEQAAKYADMAIKDMADNSAKMGTELGMLQNAYAGFSRGNFTMLDNLKLGFAGTKSGMEELLAKAKEITGQDYDISSLADIYEAIHVVQESLGIAGVASEEAATTLSGSFLSMKAAAQDFMGNLVIGENVGPSMANLANSACTFFFENLVPAIGRVIQGIPDVAITLLQNVIPNILNKITELVNNFANGDMMKNGTSMIQKFAQAIINSLPTLIQAAGQLVLALMNYILQLPGYMIKAGISAVKGLAQGIKDNFPAVVSAAKDIVSKIVTTILSLPGKLLQAGKNAVSKFVEGLKSIHLPKLSITWSSESKGKGKSLISIPVPHISWNAKGGIFDGPTVLQGVGEAGAEAVVPLTQLWDRFDNMAGQIASGVQTAMMMNTSEQRDIHLTLELEGAKVAEKIYRLNKQGEAALVG